MLWLLPAGRFCGNDDDAVTCSGSPDGCGSGIPQDGYAFHVVWVYGGEIAFVREIIDNDQWFGIGEDGVDPTDPDIGQAGTSIEQYATAYPFQPVQNVCPHTSIQQLIINPHETSGGPFCWDRLVTGTNFHLFEYVFIRYEREKEWAFMILIELFFNRPVAEMCNNYYTRFPGRRKYKAAITTADGFN